MRPSLPLQITIEHFGFWRAAVAVPMMLVIIVTALWLAQLHEDALGSSGMVRLGAALVALGAVASAATLLVTRPLSLRWDAQRWHLGSAASIGNEPEAGRLRVAVDFGGWMLLRFDPESIGRRSKPRWIPVQRSGLGAAWHALRCAVYSPRPETGDFLDSAVPASASTRPHPAE